MDEQTQWNTINTRTWYSAMRTQAATIISAMQTNGFDVKAGGWIETQVEGVYAAFQIQGNEVCLQAGQKANGDPMFTWQFPIGWVTT